MHGSSSAPMARLRSVFAGRRGSAQLGLLVVATAVAGGMTIGHGVAAHNADSGYGLAWLADGGRGQVVQVDPVLGRTNVRLQVAGPGSQLEVHQSNGQLVVIDRKTGKITSISLGTLLVSGSRTGAAGGAVKLLLAGSHLYVANLVLGTVQAVDPATEASIGPAWQAGQGLVDVAIDNTARVWALDTSSRLTTLQWNARAGRLAAVAHRSLSGTGPGSVIVAHASGVTVVGAHGRIVRVGTGHDTSLSTPQVRGPLAGPQSSPDQLVPVADPGRSSVVIVGRSDAIVDNVAALGCPRPAAPTVFDDKVYVPCSGSDRVIVLDRSGHPAGAPIPTPSGGDPQLTVSDGRLLINVPGSGTATVVDPSGSSRQFPTVDPAVGVQNPNSTPPPPLPPPSPAPTNHRHHGHGRGDTPNSGVEPTGAPGSNSPSSGGPSTAPAGGTGSASAEARPDGSVLVSWTGADASGGYTVTLQSTGEEVADVPRGATSGTVTVLTPGTDAVLVVHAYRDGGHRHELWTATTNSVLVMAAPGSPAGVHYTLAGQGGGKATLDVSWTAAAGNGGSVSYTVGASGTQTTVTTATTSAKIDVPCPSGCSGTLTVTATNEAGSGGATQAPFTVSNTRPTPPPTSNPPPPAHTTPAPPPQTTPAPPPAPAGNQDMITITGYTPGNRADGDPAEVDLTITMPADWRRWNGTCELHDNTVVVKLPSCAQATINETRDYMVSGSHTYTVVAAGTSAVSNPVTKSVVVRPGNPGCPYNWAQLPPRCIPPFAAPVTLAPVAAAPAAQRDLPSGLLDFGLWRRMS